MLSGLLEEIANDLGVSVGAAGLLTSVFAAGMVVGAPAMVMIASVIPRRMALIGFLGLFCATHVIGALTTDFAVLLVTRAFAAFAYAGFLAVALASLPVLVGASAMGRATSVILSGVTIACIAGVPAGTVLGQAMGWQSAFRAIAAISAAAIVVLWPMTAGTALDDHQGLDETGGIWREWLTLVRPGLLIVIALGVLVNAATFAGFTYLGTITATLTNPGSAWIPLALALFGISSFVGVIAAGRYSDRHRSRLIIVGPVVVAGVWLAAVFAAQTLPVLLVAALLAGAGAFGIGSALIATIVQTASTDAPRIAGAVATTAFNIGAVAGPAVAGFVVVDAEHADAALWVSFSFTAVAALLALLATIRSIRLRDTSDTEMGDACIAIPRCRSKAVDASLNDALTGPLRMWPPRWASRVLVRVSGSTAFAGSVIWG